MVLVLVGMASNTPRGAALCQAGSGPRAIRGGHGAQELDLLKGLARSLGHGAEGILGDVHGKAGLTVDELVEAAEQGPASGEDDAAVDEVRAALS